MLHALILSATNAAFAAPTAADHRLGVYVMAAIVGVLVCGAISCIKEMRSEKASRL